VLVATGNGKTAFQKLKEQGNPPDHFAENLMAAAHWITHHPGRPVP
jgi:TorA maturation chaperone TorD